MVRKVFRIILAFVGAVIGLFLLLAVALYIPPVQNFVVHKVTKFASEKTGMTLRVGRVRLAFPLDLALINTFASQRGDTVVDARSVRVNIALLPLLESRIDVDGLEIRDGKLNTIDFISNTQIKGRIGELTVKSHGIDLAHSLVSIDDGALKNSNITVLLCDTAKPDTTPSTPTVWRIKLRHFNIAGTSAHITLPGDSMRIGAEVGRLDVSNGYFDLQKSAYTVGHIGIRNIAATYDIPYLARTKRGLDLNHIAIARLGADIDSAGFKGGAVSAKINRLQAAEKSGLEVAGLSGRLYVDSARLELGGLKLRTPHSTLDATGTVWFSALKSGGAGAVKLKVGGTIDRRDIVAAVPGGLDAEVEKMLPRRPIAIGATLSGSNGALRVERGSVAVPGMAQLNIAGRLGNIAEDYRTGNLRYSLRIHDLSPIVKALGMESSIDIPRGSAIAGALTFKGSRYATNSRLSLGGGTAHINGWFDTRRSAYSAKLSTARLPLGKVVKGSGLHSLTSQIAAAGHGFDPFAKGMALSAKATLESFGISGYDFSNTKVSASLRGGKGTVEFNSQNPILQGIGKITAGFTRNSVKGSLNARLANLDIQKISGSEKPLKVSTRSAATFYANSKMTTYGIDAKIDSIVFHADSGRTVRAKDLLVKLDNHRDSLYAKVSAGDLDIMAHGPSNIAAISAQVNRFTSALDKQIKNRLLDQDALARLLPEVNLMIDAGSDNPLSNMLRFRQGYTFDHLFLSLSCGKEKGIDGTGYIHSLNTGSLLIDTVNLSLFRDSTGLRVRSLVRNTTRHNPYQFTAKLEGYLLNDGAGVEVVYKDKTGTEGMNLGLRAELTDSGTTVKMYPENPVIAFRRFKVNKDNYLTLANDKTILADIDLLADDGTGLKVYGDHTDSISDITVSVNRVNLKELTASLPFMPMISGFLSGDLHVAKQDTALTAAYNFNVNDMAYEGSPLGNIGLEGTYFPIPETSTHQVNASISRGGNEVANVDGSYYGTTDSLEACLKLEDFPTDMLNGFTGETLSFSGRLGGDLDLTGTTSKPMLNGKVLLDSVRVFSDVYGFNMLIENDSAMVANSVLRLDTLNFYSDKNNPLVADGNVDFSDLGNVNLSLNVKADNFELVNARQTAKSEVYGTVYSDIDVMVRGSLSNLFVFGNLNILPRTDVSYVLKDSPLAAENDLNSLVSFVDFSDTAAAPPKREDPTGITMSLTVNINDAARLHCDINDDKQSYIDVEGGGTLHMKYAPTGEMTLTGRYTINSGEMKYALPVIPLRTFALQEGSYIEFTGETMNPTLNIAATERVKATVNDNDNPRSVSFDVGIKLTQPLNRMGLEFTIDAPDDQTVQNQLASMGAEQKNKLAVSMLATGMYLAETNNSGGIKTSNALNAFLQSQVQQIAGKALKSVDLSLSVDDATSATGDANTDYSFRFAKRFWGNRVNVIIGGHVSTGENARNDATSFIDNVSVEYRVDNSAGRYVRVFYDHNAQDPLEGQITEAGAGLVLRRKVRTLGEVFTFWKRYNSDSSAAAKSSAAKSSKKKSKKKSTKTQAAAEAKREGSADGANSTEKQ